MANDASAVDPEKSKTYDEFIEDGLELEYLDESYAYGDYFRDAFEIGDSTVKNFTLGLGLNTTLMHGVVGIGYMLNEASVLTSDVQYDNLPVALAKANVTNSIAYSLWLNDFGKGPAATRPCHPKSWRSKSWRSREGSMEVEK